MVVALCHGCVVFDVSGTTTSVIKSTLCRQHDSSNCMWGHEMRHLKLSQQCCCRLQSSGMWCCVVAMCQQHKTIQMLCRYKTTSINYLTAQQNRMQTVTDKDHSTFNFRAQQSWSGGLAASHNWSEGWQASHNWSETHSVWTTAEIHSILHRYETSSLKLNSFFTVFIWCSSNRMKMLGSSMVTAGC
jgi:hypothetical protein